MSRRVVTLPDRGRLLVATDLQGNIRDFCAIERIFEEQRARNKDTILVITGDLVHGPELSQDEWPDYLGTYYVGDSPGLLHRAKALLESAGFRVEVHRGQMEAYRRAVARMERVPPERVRARLLFVTAGVVRDV